MEGKEQIRLVFATGNRHKIHEIQHAIGSEVHVEGLAELGFNGEIPEDQDTLEGNAVQKAMFIYDRFGTDCFADDTGLEIEALGGAPGVYSARYAGAHCSFEDNMNKVLKAMKDIDRRQARFRTVIALIEKGKVTTFEGEVRGIITREKHGMAGFGYDPVFLPEGHDKTFAEMDLEEKNRISHRARAVKKLTDYLRIRYSR
jgi:XTP/dITP diphosphohydrolase